jgi:hypothetical protein
MLPAFLRGPFAALSDHLVYSSSLYADLRSRVTRMEGAMIDFSRPGTTPADARCREAARLIRPYTTSATLLRVGDEGDGGYVMADHFTTTTAISIGIGGNVSWDLAMSSRGYSIAMFDPTIAAAPTTVQNATFHRIGIGTPVQSAASGLELESLEQLRTRAGIPEAEAATLKIDVEGAEWDALVDVASFNRYEQIVIEMHDLARLDDEESARNVLAVLANIHASHVPIHVHANNEAPVIPFGTYWLPDVFEVSYLRRADASAVTPAFELSIQLDRASNARFADLSLSGLLTVDPITA